VISTEMTLVIPNLEDFTFADSMEAIPKYLEISVKKNFQDGGRPVKWEPKKKDGSPSHLFMTGVLFNTIGSDSGVDFAEAGAMTLLPYSLIHQFGYNGVRRDGKYMHMPIREYVMFQGEDIDQSIQLLGDGLVSFWDSRGEPVN